jgi:NAD(P)-dependent dehydrogenase (short-subunit alcohol dehydrogenase family)
MQAGRSPGRTALFTVGLSGLGLHFAQVLAQHGAQ